MKKIVMLLMAVGITCAARAQFHAETNPLLTRSLSAEQIKKVFASTPGGSITVTGTRSGEAKLEVYVTSADKNTASSKAAIQQLLEEHYALTITIADHELRAIANYKDGEPKNKLLTISFKLLVPQQVSTDLQTSGGSISLADLTGDEKFSTSGGSLHLENLHGTIKGGTSGGNVQAKNSSGDIVLSTSGGSLTIEELQGTINTSAGGGSISGTHIGGSLIAHTGGGSVTLLDMACALDASTSGGRMRVMMKELPSAITLDNAGGNIDLSLPGAKGLDLKLRASKIDAGELNNFNGSKKAHEVIGTLNGGGILVTVNTGTGSGSITLAFKE